MHQDPNQRMGRGMIWVSMIVALGLLTWFFSDVIDQRNNPNSNVQGVVLENAVEVSLQRNRYGHYVATGYINDQSVDFLIDTGATDVVLSSSLADELDLQNLGPITMSTANGVSRGYITRINELRLGPIVARNIQAIVAPNLDLEVLLGMTVLQQLDWQQQGDQLILRQTGDY